MSSITAMAKNLAIVPEPVSDDVVRRRIAAALKTTGGNVGTAAILLGANVRTLRRRMRALGFPTAKPGPKPKKKGKPQ